MIQKMAHTATWRWLRPCLIGCLALGALLSDASAANRYWIATTAADWANTANWATNSGGAGGASVPAGTDIAVFDGAGGTTGDCAIASAITVQAIQMGVGYSGTVDAAANDVTLTSANITAIHGGRLRSTSGTLRLMENVTITTNGVLEKTGGDTVWNVGGNRFLFLYPGETGRTQELHNLILTNHNYVLAVQNNALLINGNLTFAPPSSGGLAGNIWLKGDMVIGSYNAGSYTFCGTGLQTITHNTNLNSTVNMDSLIVTNASVQGVRLDSPLSVSGNNGNLIVYAGCRLDCNGKALTTFSGWNLNPACTFIAPPLWTCNNGGIRTIYPGGHIVNDMIMSSSEPNNYYFSLTANLIVQGDLAIVGGGLQGASYWIRVGGDLTKLGSRTLNIASFQLNGAGAQTLTVTSSAGFASPLIVTNTGTVYLGTNLTVVGKITTISSNATLHLNGWDLASASGFTNRGTLVLSGTETVTPPNNAAGSTVRYEAAAPVSVNAWTYRNLVLAGAGAGVIYTMPAADMAMSWFQCSVPATEVIFNEGSTYSATHILFGGSSGTKIRLRSSSGGQKWYFNVSEPPEEVMGVDVSDSDASGGETIRATRSTNSGGNLNWRFAGTGTVILLQ